MSCKSALYAVNTTAGTSIPVGSALPLTQIIRRFGNGANLNGNAITLFDRGYYEVNATITVTASAAGAVTASLYKDGTLVPGATGTVTAAANDVVTIPLACLVRVACCGESRANLTVVISGQEVTTNNAAVTATKL